MSKKLQTDSRSYAEMDDTNPSTALDVANLTKIYNGETIAVDDISFSIEEGNYCVIIGPSGCGKSTTLHSIVGKLNVTEGSIELDGVDITNLPTYDRDIGLVFQDFQLFPNMTVEENIRYGLDRIGETGPEAEQSVENLLELLNIEDVRNRYPKEISAGQKQRCALGRSLVLDPSLMLLDEPLGDLDYRLQKELETELLRIHQNRDVTFVHVTHDQRQAMRLADQIVVMNDGKIEQSGTVEEIYEQPATAFVAAFVGDSNIMSGTVTSVSEDREYLTIENQFGTFTAGTHNLDSDPREFHDEDLTFATRPSSLVVGKDADNSLACGVDDVLYQPGSGTQVILKVKAADGSEKEIRLKSKEKLEISDDTVNIGWDADDTLLLEQISVVPGTNLEKDILGT